MPVSSNVRPTKATMRHSRIHRNYAIARAWLALATMLLVSGEARAEGFDVFSEHQRLNDQVVIASGNIAKFTRVSIDSSPSPYPSLTRPAVYQIGTWCFSSSENIDGKAGLLLVDRGQSVSVAVLTTQISTIKLSFLPTTLLSCSALQQQDSKALLNQLEAQRKQVEALMQSLRQQQQNQRKGTQ